MSFWRYTLANAIGLLPAMFAYTVLGHDLALARDSTWRISLLLLGGLAVFLAGRWWLIRQRRRVGVAPEA